MLSLLAALSAYVVVAYLVLPFLWRHHEHQPALAAKEMVTRTSLGIAGDPLNIGLVGSREDVICAMRTAGWLPADPVTLASSLEIVGSVLLDRPYREAPVSPLLYEGREQDLAFEQEVGNSARQRRHVRFWKVLDSGVEQRPVWLGSATFDRGVELARYTLQVTHRIAPDIDATRDELLASLKSAGRVSTSYEISGIGPTVNGRNGGGDRYFTDGEIKIARLTGECNARGPDRAAHLPSPVTVEAKNRLWKLLRVLF